MKCILCNKKINKTLTKKIRNDEPIKVYYCPSCDLGLLEDNRTKKEIINYYKGSYRKEYTPKLSKKTNAKELFNTYVNFQEDRLKLIKPYLSKKKTLLEIGSSAGMFLYHMKDKVKKAYGIDFDLNSSKFARKKCSVEIFNDDITNTPLKERSLDIICAFQTLEHLKDPLTFLKQLKKYLKDDGILNIEVPNLHDALASVYDLPYHKQFYYHAAHLLYFSKKSLNLLLEKAGFSGEFYFTQDYNLLNHLNWIMNDKPQNNCLAGLNEPKFTYQAGIAKTTTDQLNKFISTANKNYKELLTKLEITSNIYFIGKKIK
jgi:SAM-dependent methyltransferase